MLFLSIEPLSLSISQRETSLILFENYDIEHLSTTYAMTCLHDKADVDINSNLVKNFVVPWIWSQNFAFEVLVIRPPEHLKPKCLVFPTNNFNN